MTVTPIRTCLGCGRKAPRAELVRFVAHAGAVVPDPTGRAPGRGAYTCPRRPCVERATARRAFARSLRHSVRVPPGLSDRVAEV